MCAVLCGVDCLTLLREHPDDVSPAREMQEALNAEDLLRIDGLILFPFLLFYGCRGTISSAAGGLPAA